GAGNGPPAALQQRQTDQWPAETRDAAAGDSCRLLLAQSREQFCARPACRGQSAVSPVAGKIQCPGNSRLQNAGRRYRSARPNSVRIRYGDRKNTRPPQPDDDLAWPAQAEFAPASFAPGGGKRLSSDRARNAAAHSSPGSSGRNTQF